MRDKDGKHLEWHVLGAFLLSSGMRRKLLVEIFRRMDRYKDQPV